MASLVHSTLLPNCSQVSPTTLRHRLAASQRPSPAAFSSCVVQNSFWPDGIRNSSAQFDCKRGKLRRSSPSFILEASVSTAAAEKASGGKSAADEDSGGVGPARVLYPAKPSHKQGRLQVSDLHTLYYEVFGNPKGQPVVFLHGGPGAGCYPNHSRFFDLEHYRVLLFDQRGCGRSTPRGCLQENTTWDLVSDIEKLRRALGVEKWLVCGGSWGVTLALAYAQSHPERVLALVLRGVCMLRRSEIDWFYRQGASALFPFGWQDLLSAVEPSEHGDLIPAFYKRLTSGDSTTADSAARAWLRWEMGLSFFQSSPAVFTWDGKEYRTFPSPLVPNSGTPAPSKPPPAAPASSPAPPQTTTTGSGETAPADSATSAPGSRGKSPTGPAPVRRQQDSNGAPTEGAKKVDSGGNSPAVPRSEGDVYTAKPPPPYQVGPGTSAAAAVAVPVEKVAATAGKGGAATRACDGERDMAGSPSMSSTLVQARLECHYFVHGGFLEESQLLAGVDAIRAIPCVIVQGRFDFVCPLVNAYDLHRAWPEAELRVVPNAGHSMYEPGIVHELVSATDRLRSLEY